jgi:hypothetical protein
MSVTAEVVALPTGILWVPNPQVAWSSSNTAVITITQSGLVITTGAGTLRDPVGGRAL